MSVNRFRHVLLCAATLLCFSAPSLNAADVVIVNMDGPGEGFNDPTPAAPIGGNAGTTVGQQRLIAFQYAASIWAQKLAPTVDVSIQATFDPLACTATSGVLGAAGAIQVFSSTVGAPFEYANTWYHVALANKLAGVDLAPGPPGTAADDLQAIFNANLGTPGCLQNSGWYYGLDANEPANRINLVVVLLHEFAHGLGFANFVNEGTGAMLLGQADIFSRFTFDGSTGKTWDQMSSNAERAASARNGRKVVWRGLNVTGAVPQALSPGTPGLRITAPAAIAGFYSVGLAAFGPPLSSPGVTGQLVQALDASDAAGPLTTDGCSALLNAPAVAGKIAVIDRGTCPFILKVKNAQNAGAIGVIIADNVAGSPPASLGGVDPTITIPSAPVMLVDGNLIKAQLGAGVTGTLGIDNTVRNGADAQGRAMLFMPNPVQSGSSGSHWDTSAFANQLMEPAINSDLTLSVDTPQDLTTALMRDIGWFADGDGVPDPADQCPSSDKRSTIVIQGCDTQVANTLFANGCKISDILQACMLGAKNEGQYTSCVSDATNELRRNSILSNTQHGAIQSCAAKARIP